MPRLRQLGCMKGSRRRVWMGHFPDAAKHDHPDGMEMIGRSIPHIPSIEWDAVSLQKSAVFRLKCFLPMMLRLIGAVSLQSSTMRRADGKHPVSILPMEVGISRSLGLQPFGGASFYLQYQLRWRAGARVSDQQVNVVGDRTHLEQRSLLIFNNPTKVSVEFISDLIGQCGFPILRREDQMHQDLGELSA